MDPRGPFSTQTIEQQIDSCNFALVNNSREFFLPSGFVYEYNLLFLFESRCFAPSWEKRFVRVALWKWSEFQSADLQSGLYAAFFRNPRHNGEKITEADFLKLF